MSEASGVTPGAVAGVAPRAGAGPTKARQAYLWLRDRIADGRFPPGERLVLGAIAAELDMSVGPVRDAVGRLQAEGLIVVEPHVGARVTAVDNAHYLAALQVIGIVESTATALSVPHLTFDDLSQARALNAAMRGALRDFDPRQFSTLNQRFHRVLYARCPNAILLDILANEWTRLANLRDTIFNFVPGRPAESVNEHDALLDLIERGSAPGDVEMAMRRHRAGTLRAYLEHGGAERSLLLPGEALERE